MNYRINEIAAEAQAFEKLLSEVPGGEKLKTCIQCGSCSATCLGAAANGITHRKFWRMIHLGEVDEVYGASNEWNCTTCGLCEARCPRGIPLTKIILKLREAYAAKVGTPEKMVLADKMLEETHNIGGNPASDRLLWYGNMGEGKAEIEKVMAKDSAEVLYFIGCVSSLFPQAYKIPQSLSKILLKSGVDFGFFGANEWCCGFPYLNSGKGEEAMKANAEANLAFAKKMGAKTILMSCPSCAYVFKEVYPKLVPEWADFEILHYTEYLTRLVEQGALKFKADPITVTYHDSCDLGRKSGIFDAPRALIKLSGAKFSEMRFNGKEAKCCGGGGNLEMQNADLSHEIAGKRVKEAVDTGAEVLLCACQQCKRTLQGGARAIRSRIKVNDLLEFLADRLED